MASTAGRLRRSPRGVDCATTIKAEGKAGQGAMAVGQRICCCGQVHRSQIGAFHSGARAALTPQRSDSLLDADVCDSQQVLRCK